MRLIDKIRDCAQRNEVLPLKGKIRIITQDIRDGREEVMESENIATSAIQSILNHNYGLLTNFNNIIPLRSMYSGVLCFQNEISENASNFNPPNDLLNPLIAHAGNSANTSGSLLRGSPVNNDFVVTDTSIKQVWLWDNTQGNGTIRTVCLCPGSLGNMGLKPYSAMSVWSSLAMENTIGRTDCSTLTRAEAIKRPISISADGKTGKSIWWNGTTFEEISVRHDWNAYGIMRDLADYTIGSTTVHSWHEDTSRSATVRTFTRGKSSLFEDEDYYWLYEISSSSLKIDKVKKSDFTVTQADVSYSGISLYNGTVANAKGAYWFMNVPRWAYDGTYLYLPNSSANGFVAVNPSDGTDAVVLDGTISLYVGVAEIAYKSSIRPIVVSPGLIFGENYIINGSTVYQTEMTSPIHQNDTTGRTVYLDTIRQGAAVYGMPYRADTYDYRRGQGAALLSLFLSTISVLPDAKTKSTSQTMRIEYTSSEAT